MFSHKDVLPSGRILVFMITLGKTFFYLSVSTFIIASMISPMSLRNDIISSLTSIFFDWNCGLVVRKSPSWLRLKTGKVSWSNLALRLKISSISFSTGCIWCTLTRFRFPSCWTVSMPPSTTKIRKRSCAVSRKRRTAAFRSQPSRKIAELKNLTLLNCWESSRRWG